MSEVKIKGTTSEELIDNWAGAINDPLAFQIARRAVENALWPLSGGAESLMNGMDAVLRRMDKEDMDMPHQSRRLRQLGKTFADMRRRLIAILDK
ncbi:MAG: hypothetical protein Q8Q48_04225 [Candidatus Staskawiczbacteria bacterium]|nr:hypothetical protein [Candidatus Staskawiczbacteria bacterium]